MPVKPCGTLGTGPALTCVPGWPVARVTVTSEVISSPARSSNSWPESSPPCTERRNLTLNGAPSASRPEILPGPGARASSLSVRATTSFRGNGDPGLSSKSSLLSPGTPRKMPSGNSSTRLSGAANTWRLSDPASQPARNSVSWFWFRNRASSRLRPANASAGMSASSLIASAISVSSGRSEKTPGGSSVSWFELSQSRSSCASPEKASAGISPIRFMSRASHSRFASPEKTPGGRAAISLSARSSRLSEFGPAKASGATSVIRLLKRYSCSKLGTAENAPADNSEILFCCR